MSVLVSAKRKAQVLQRCPITSRLRWTTCGNSPRFSSFEGIVNCQYSGRHINYKLVEKNMMRTKSTTFEVQLPGIKTYVTVDPINIKAILATQFQDFGKGPLFHESWKEVRYSENGLTPSSSVMEFSTRMEQDGRSVEPCCDPNSSGNEFQTYKPSKSTYRN
jgi:hypothetical protein